MTGKLSRPVLRGPTPGNGGRLLGGMVSLIRTRYDASESRSEEHTSELQSRLHLVCRLLLEKKNDHTHVQAHLLRDVRILLLSRRRRYHDRFDLQPRVVVPADVGRRVAAVPRALHAHDRLSA